jgi:hypothetical protein
MRLRLFLLLIVGAVACAPAVQAQAPPAAPPAAEQWKPAFPQLFPQPTGRNGYEEFVLAGDLARGHAAFRRATLGTPTLEEKRVLLADRTLARALTLVRQGLRKPVLSPRRDLNFSTTLPEVTTMRDVGRLLAIQEYVQLADGRTGEALDTFAVGLAFARAIQFDTLIQGLVGVAITAQIITPLSRRLDQLSARDCGRLYDISLQWLRQPNPYIQLLSGEWRGLRSSLQAMRDTALREGPDKAAAEILGPDSEELRRNRHLIPRAAADIDRVFQDVFRLADQHYLRLQEEMRKEPWERRPVEVDRGSPAGAMLGLLVPAHQMVDSAYTRDNARLRLLALHAVIRRYQWEHDRLPASLAGLQVEELARDPFTGQAVRYEVRGQRYTLTAAGPEARDANDPQAIDGRLPVRLTPDD